MSIIMKENRGNMFPVLGSWIWSLVPWIASGLACMGSFLIQTALFSVNKTFISNVYISVSHSDW